MPIIISHMRPLLPALALLFASCFRPAAYQPPRVAVAADYSVVAAARSTRTVGTVAPAGPGGVATTPGSARYSTTAPAQPFWRVVGDTMLERLIAEALRTGTDVLVAEARLTRTRAARRLSAFDLAPTITATGSAMRQQMAIAQLPGLTSRLPQRDLWDVGFDASWEIDLFQRQGRVVSAQNALVSSAEHGIADIQVSLAAEVARTYFELRGSERQLEVAQRNAENQRRTVALTQEHLAAGRGTAFDTERANSVLQLTLAGIPNIEARIAADRNRIAVLLGRTPGSTSADLVQSGDLPSLPDSVQVGSPAALVKRRPDVLRAEREASASGLLVGAAQAEYLPRLTLGARVGFAATRFDSLSRSGTSRLLYGPVLSWPLLDLGRVKTRVDIAAAQENEARARYDATVLRAIEETETSLVAYDRAHSRLATLGEAVRSSTRASNLAQQRFEAGLTDFLQVLDAQRTLLETENQLAQAHTAAGTALVAVYKAIGGTWPVR